MRTCILRIFRIFLVQTLIVSLHIVLCGLLSTVSYYLINFSHVAVRFDLIDLSMEVSNLRRGCKYGRPRTNPGTKLSFIFIISALYLCFGQSTGNDAPTCSSPTSQSQSCDATISKTSDKTTCNEKMEELETRIKDLEGQTTKKYPDVKFLTYKDRKRILITGGAGFVGSHLVDRLMLDGHEVSVADNFFTGRKRNVEQWIGHENFELINHDIVNPLYIEVDEIYHLASPASPPHYMFNPVKTIKTNTVGTVNMLGLAKRVQARVLIASTSEVYGDPEVHPQPESYWGHVNPIGPRACYDEGKRVAEALSYAYAKQENVNVRVARIFNTYGPRMHMNDGRVVSNFILQALQNTSLTIYGSGKQTRSFQYVSDLVEGLIALMRSNYTQPVNIGNPEEHTIEEFALLIRNLVGSTSSEIEHLDPVEDDPQQRRPDITIAKKELKWTPVVPLNLGLQKTIEYFRKELQRSSHSERNIIRPDENAYSYQVAMSKDGEKS